jgi:hypothetical protein
MLLGQIDTIQVASLALFETKVGQRLLRFAWLPDQYLALLAKNVMPTPTFDPGNQRNMLKLTVPDDPDLTSFRDQFCHPAEQGDLFLYADPPLFPAVNAPDQRQSPFAVGDAYRHQPGVESQLGRVDDQPNRLTPKGINQRLGHRPIVSVEFTLVSV